MTLYSGEGVLITHIATLESVALDNTDVSGVTVEIFNSAGVVVVPETAMSWDATDSRWEYDWDTATGTPTESGTYKAKCVVTNLDSSVNWEIKRIRLSSSPV